MNTGAVLSFNFFKPVNLDDIQTSILLLWLEHSKRDHGMGEGSGQTLRDEYPEGGTDVFAG